MALRTLSALKAYFYEHAYPTWQQFHDVLDSFRHKSDTIAISEVDDLSTQLNDKVSTSVMTHEISTREAVETTLQTNIDNEASTRQQSYTTLSNRMSDETTDRIAGDAQLASALSDVSSALSVIQTWKAAMTDADSDNIINTLTELLDLAKNVPEGTDLSALLAAKVSTSDIVNNLTSALTNAPLSAYQGNVLKGLIDTLNDNLSKKENTASKGMPFGYASLDVDGKVPESQLPDSALEVTKQQVLDVLGYQSVDVPGTFASLDFTGKIPAAQIPDIDGNKPSSIYIDSQTGHLIFVYPDSTTKDAGKVTGANVTSMLAKVGDELAPGSNSAYIYPVHTHAYCLQVQNSSSGNGVIKFRSSSTQTIRFYHLNSQFQVADYLDVNLTVGANVINAPWIIESGDYIGVDASADFLYLLSGGIGFYDVSIGTSRGLFPGTIPLSFTYYYLVNTAKEYTNKLSTKKIYLYGDSVSSTDYSWYGNFLTSKLNATVTVGGKSGYTASQLTDNSILNSIIAENPDLLLILLGGNDSGSAGSVGTFMSTSLTGESTVAQISITGNYTGNTYIQAVDYIIRYLRSNALYGSRKKIIVLNGLPQQRNNSSDSFSLHENHVRKIKAVEEVCDLNHVPCIDIFKLCGWDMSLEPFWTSPTDKINSHGIYTMDGLHPNDSGYDVITEVICEYLRQIKI